MANMFEMLKQAASMKKEMGKVQKDLAEKSVEHSCDGGRVVVVATGDMTIKSIKVDPAIVDSSQVEKLEGVLVRGVNGALKTAKKEAAREMSRIAGGMGLGGLLG